MNKEGKLFKSHPWHGVSIGESAPEICTVYIEIVPSDSVKYEVDKESGLLKVDRPQLFSNFCPALYGFIPKTYCAENIASYASKKSGKNVPKGDGDPLDILVLCEKNIPRGDILVQAIPLGGLRMIDQGEADDKIIAVLKDDAIYGKFTDINDIPKSVRDRIKHYFLTYKLKPGEECSGVDLDAEYGREEALEVIRCSIEDYQAHLSGFNS